MQMLIKVLDPATKHLYDKKNYGTDSGFDIAIPVDHVIPPFSANDSAYKIKLGIACTPTRVYSSDYQPQGYILCPRSSIVKTPLRMSNSIGIIDADYTGELIAYVDNISSKDFEVKAGTRLFQICAPDHKPFEVTFVDELPKTERGDKGFGSTGC